MFSKKERKKENVRQHQYGVLASGKSIKYLSTKGIWICTGWYGWDSKNEVAFLCHFDHPASALSVLRILKEVRKMVPEDHHFETTLIGGKGWFWSRWTRQCIKDLALGQTRLNVSINEEPFRNCFTDKVDVTIFPKTGIVSLKPIAKGNVPRKKNWFFGPVRKSKLMHNT